MGGRPAGRSLTAILAMIFVYMLGRSMALPLVPGYYQSSSLSVADIGLVLGSFAFAFLVSEAGWGFASDLLKRRSTMFVLIGASSLTSLAYTRPQPLLFLVVLQLFSAVCLGGIGLFPRLTISRVTDAGSRGVSFGYLGLVFALGPMTGAVLGALLSGLIGTSETFITMAAVSVLAIVPLRFVRFGLLPRPRGSAPSEGGQESVAARRLQPLQLLVVGAVGMTYSTASAFYSLLFPNILTQDPAYHATVLQLAIVISVFGLSSGVLQPIIVFFSSRSPRTGMAAGLLASGVTFLLLLGYPPMAGVYAIAFAAGASVAATAPLALLVLSSGVPDEKLGRALGVFGAAEDFGIVVGGSVGTFIWALSGPGTAFLAVGAQCLLVGAAAAAALRPPRQRNSQV